MIRDVQKEDAVHLAQWCLDPETSQFLPISDENEVKETSCRWVEMAQKNNAGKIALFQGAVVGFGLLFLQEYVRLKHEASYILIIDRAYRDLKVEEELIEALIELAKSHRVELLHTEIYDDAEMLEICRKLGFVEFGRQEKWTDDNGVYRARIMMEKFI